ncbi:MAG: ABC transporter permease [Acidobacteria bacterium]|nr:ABC transporter permease [Acidobacteriota bacterium]MBI3423387.1 ABC transporter permease [Acidobacteriota bacterium]
MTTFWQDLRYAVRMLRGNPGVTLAAVLSLALGIGAAAAIFSVVDALLLRPLPYPEAGRLVVVREVNTRGGQMSLAEPNYEDLSARSQSFSTLAMSAGSFQLVVTGGSEPRRARVSYASGSFFEVMGVQPHAGRVFLPEETKYGGPKAALVSYEFWQRQLGARADLSAARLNVDGALCNVVGVLPPGFDYPAETEVWVTTGIEPPNTSRTAHNWPVVGRLRAGVTLQQARAEVSAIGQRIRQENGAQLGAAPDFAMTDFALTPLQEHLTRNVRAGLWLLLGAVGLLLLVACANAANLLLAQLTARQREFAVRAALGAGRWQITRQLVVENLVLTLASAGLGALLASFGVDVLLQLEQGSLPRLNPVGVDGRVLFFAGALAVLIGVVLGCLPALRFGQQDLQAALKEGGRGQSAGALSQRLRGALVIAQLALTLVLLTGAGLLGRSFIKLWQTDPGFKPERAVVMRLSLPSTVTPQEDERTRLFYVQLLARVQQLTGVGAVGGINSLPLAERGANGTFLLDGDPAQRGTADYRVASGGFFTALGVPLLRGRFFDERDTVNAPHAALINQALAARYWPNRDPLGQRIQFGNMDGDKHILTVVGVVGDVRDALDAPVEPTVYACSVQRPQWWQVSRLAVVVRSPLEPAALIPALRATVLGLRADVPLNFSTLPEVFSASLDQRRFSLVIFGAFALVALLLAALGVYGVMSYVVTQRTHELGIRLALGAGARDVLRLVIGQGLRLALAGIALGLLAALAATRLLATLVYGVSTTDPLTFAGIAVLLLTVAFLACWLPARRAARVDPLVALRCE